MLDTKQEKPMTMGENISAAVGLCQIISMPLLLVLRRWGTMGERISGGLQMVLGCLFLIVVIGLSNEKYLGPYVMYVMLVLFLVHNGKRKQLQRKGYRVHSMYTGIPWFGGDKVKGSGEPSYVLLIGMFTLPFSLVLGGYVMVAGVCLGVSYSYFQARMDAQVRALRDAKQEQELLRELVEAEERRI